MKLISARSSREASPFITAKRAPESLAARSKSRMPRASPTSQWDLGSKANRGTSPHFFTSTLSASLLPAGSESWQRLGIPMTMSFKSVSAAESLSSSSLIRSPISRTSAISASASWPAFLSWPISWEAVLRWLRSPSTSVSS